MNWPIILTKLSLVCGIPPANIESIVRVESNYCKYTVSKSSTSVGCMQLIKANRNPADDHSNPIVSMLRGVDYLCNLKSRFPKTYMIRYHVGPNGDINSDAAKEYKRRLNLENKYFNR